MLEVNFQKKLWNFNLHCQFYLKDEILVLWGPSGAGKSTILHCLAGLLQPDSGYIKINDKMVFDREAKINLPSRQRRIGYLFQDYNLFPHMTVQKNILYGYKNLPTAIRQTHPNPLDFLAMFGIEHLLKRYPGQLSGGEKQRVAIARALSAYPEVLLLDE
ncbi:MAG: ATP-binding cassette domain-containing protein, partial [Clostridia bacterium]|nr:ATP-binding cassette domain-containing protein [Clostridia bacterium]